MNRLILTHQGKLVNNPRGEYVEYAEVAPLLQTAIRLLERENRIMQYDEVSRFLQALRLEHRFPTDG